MTVEHDRESAYEYVRGMIVAIQGHNRPAAPVAERAVVRRRCCDSGSLAVDAYETALAALDEHDVIARGDRYVGHYPTRDLATAAIEYVADQPEPDKRFIGAVNALAYDDAEGSA